jgi:hypothetical protein
MAVVLEFISLIIPIKIIEAKYPGGWKQYLLDNEEFLGITMWYDEHLHREGAMSPADIKDHVDQWEDVGLTAFEGSGDEQRWQDMCVVDELRGPTLNCDWIIVDYGAAHMRGYPPGEIAGRDEEPE